MASAFEPENPVRLRALVLSLALAAGCANPGPPRAPSLHLPDFAESLEATRTGNTVLLTWTTPSTTTDGGTSRLPLTAIVCRDISPTTACTPIQRLAAAPGPARATDPLPPELLNGAPQLLAYRVQLLNRDGRGAGPSAPVFTASGTAPAPITAFTVTSARHGALLTWEPAAGQATVQITRSTPAPKGKPPAKPTLLTPAAPSPLGTLDPTPLNLKFDGTPFTYTAQRVLPLTVAGHAVELRGLPSPAVTFVFHDTFPPDAPTGLLAIPTPNPPAIDLSWEPSDDTDVFGYLIYRRDATHPFAPLNPKPLPAPSFRDLSARPNIPYAYRVTAVDRHHNESQPSPEVKETIQP